MSKSPNVVFMLADNVGWGDLSCHGGQVPTPRLDELPSHGLRLTNFNTEAQCTPAPGSAAHWTDACADRHLPRAVAR